MTKGGYHLGFVGLGRMGGPMVRRLLDAGHDVTVFDVSAEAVRRLLEHEAAAAGSAAEVASAAEIVLTSLPTPDVLQEVALGEADHGPGHRHEGSEGPRWAGHPMGRRAGQRRR